MSIQSNFPAIKPSLLLDFANTKMLDSRVAFTRASTGTYYNGVTTAKAEENLLLRSQDYSATWTVTSLTPVTSKTAPDSTSTATEFTATAADAVLTQGYTAIAGAYTFSVWLRRVTGTGDIQIAADNGTWTTKVITGTWARYDVTQTVAAGSKTAGVRVVTSTDAIEVWGAQLEQRSVMTAYTATTTQAITNYVPVLLTAQSGVPRFDHNPTTDESLGLLIEESRTNLLLYSEQFDNAAWVKSNTTISANVIVAPDGTVTADKLVENTSTLVHDCRQVVIKATSQINYAATFYAKAAERTFVRMFLYNEPSTNRIDATVNLSNGTVSYVTSNGTWTEGGCSVLAIGNGWYRITVTGLSNTLNTVRLLIATSNGPTSGDSVYTGDGYSGIYIWGAQLEAASFATSYIQTVAAAVTRAADAASMTGTNFSSWYNQGEGGFYTEGSTNGTTGQLGYFAVSDGTTANEIDIRIASGVRRSFVVVNSVEQANISNGNYTVGTTEKRAVSYRVNLVDAAANGVLGVQDTSALLPVVNQLRIGSLGGGAQILNGTIKKISYYPMALSTANLQALTN